jgi:ABC-type nitrate/sulfonate/bicarbonate transport system substrate-binding protein
MKKILPILAVLIVLSMLAAACQPAGTPVPTPAMPPAADTPAAPPANTPAAPAADTPAAPPADTPAAPPADTPAPAANLETTTLRFGFGVDPVFAPHIVAMEKGWFAEAGFTNVETVTFTAGALAGEALAAGEIELWTPGNVPPISMIHNGLPIVVIGSNTGAYIERFVMRTDAVLEQPEDLYNIRIGLLEGSTASAVLNNIVEEYGLDITRMQVVNLPPPEQMTSLINNEIQAFIVWNPWPYLAEQSPDVDVRIMHDGTTSYFPWAENEPFQTSFTRSLWVTSERFIQNSPNAARAMTQVLLRAQDYVRDPANRAEVVELISTYLNQPVAQNQALWDDYDFDPVIDQAYVRDMQAYTDFLFEAGRIERQLDPLSYTYTGFLEEYDPSYVQVQGQWTP